LLAWSEECVGLFVTALISEDSIPPDVAHATVSATRDPDKVVRLHVLSSQLKPLLYLPNLTSPDLHAAEGWHSTSHFLWFFFQLTPVVGPIVATLSRSF